MKLDDFIHSLTHWDNGLLLLTYLLAFAILLLLVIIAAGVYNLLDWWGSVWVDSSGTIEQHQYQAATTSTGIGVAAGQNGASPIVTSSSTEEEYILFVREKETGAIFKFETDMQSYFDFHDGRKVNFSKRIGRISKTVIDQKFI